MKLPNPLQRRFERVKERTMDAIRLVREDVQAVRDRDPAAASSAEVLLLYPGVHALIGHRVAHSLHTKGHTFAARAVSQTVRLLTGIEIHPGATIGRRLVIDHGAAVVIGETAEIGDDCTIYQGVTLGGTGKDTGKRHPTIGNHVLIGAGAKVLGPFKVGDGAKIAAGAVVLEEVPPSATAVGIPARVVRLGNQRVCDEDLDQIHIPNPVEQEIMNLGKRVCMLEMQLHEQKTKEKQTSADTEREDTPNASV